MIAVLTCPRQGVRSPYLDNTLKDIDTSAKSVHKIIVCDGIILDPQPGWTCVQVAKPTTYPENRWSLWVALKLAVDFSEDLILFEDDIKLCVNAAAVIEELEVPLDVAFASFFAPFGDGTTPYGWWKSTTRNYVFAQCLKIPLRTCKELVSATAEMQRCRLGGSDEVLKIMGTSRCWQWALHYPSLVQHVGADSAVGNGNLRGTRVSRDFPSPEFDARSLRQDIYR